MNSKSTMTREEQRKARARLDQERHLAKVKKEKNWLAANPHIAAQQEREKEEQRLNRETIRMLKAMKEEEVVKKKKKPVNAFAALMDDSDSDEDEDKDEQWNTQMNNLKAFIESQDYVPTPSLDEKLKAFIESQDYVPTPNPEDEPKKKFVWADECDE